jgi:hypothetical protein
LSLIVWSRSLLAVIGRPYKARLRARACTRSKRKREESVSSRFAGLCHLAALVIANCDANHFTRNDDFDAAIKLPASNRVVAGDWIRLPESG